MANLTVPIQINGFDLTIKAIEDFASKVEWSEEASADYIQGVNDTLNSIIEGLKAFRDKEKEEGVECG